MFSAISFGVFCRCAPSTSAIIRSMNVSPGLEVICTTIRSDSTLVPPVTADRSPPDSRMTGADSPVIADSSTEATPSTTSPSPGMISPASTTTWSPSVSWVPGTSSSRVSAWPGCQPISRRATVSRLVWRSVSACALPRPSATASARLANTTVSHSQTTIVQLKIDGLGDRRVGGQRRADLDHEHDRVADLDPRVQLLERVRRATSTASWGRGSRRRSGAPRRRPCGPRRPRAVSLSQPCQCSPSANGPSASAGK